MGPARASDDRRGEAPPPAAPCVAATRVLVVEDEGMIAWMIEGVLQDMGFSDIALVSTGAQALAAADAAAPGLLVSDVNLGGGPDGIETACKIALSHPVPVVFVTAYADDATRDRIARLVPGARLLRKPVQSAVLQAVILTLLERPAAH